MNNSNNSNNKSIAYLEDDQLQCARISKWLKAHGFNCNAFNNAKAIKQSFISHQYDIILLDWQLDSGSSGLEVLTHFRTHYDRNVPVLFLSSKNDPSDVESAHNAGANDFLTKPIAQYDLIKALEAYLVPVSQQSSLDTVDLTPYTNNRLKSQLSLNEKPLKLSDCQYSVITYLFKHCGQTVSSAVLLELICKQPGNSELTRIEPFIQALKKSINIRASQRWKIETIHSYGYRLVDH